MVSDMVIVAIIANIGVVVAAWISHGKKLDHITVLTNSTHQAAMDRIEQLEAQVERLKDDR